MFAKKYNSLSKKPPFRGDFTLFIYIQQSVSFDMYNSLGARYMFYDLSGACLIFGKV